MAFYFAKLAYSTAAIDINYFPHVVEAIYAACDAEALFVMSQTCRVFRKWAMDDLTEHVVVERKGNEVRVASSLGNVEAPFPILAVRRFALRATELARNGFERGQQASGITGPAEWDPAQKVFWASLTERTVGTLDLRGRVPTPLYDRSKLMSVEYLRIFPEASTRLFACAAWKYCNPATLVLFTYAVNYPVWVTSMFTPKMGILHMTRLTTIIINIDSLSSEFQTSTLGFDVEALPRSVKTVICVVHHSQSPALDNVGRLGVRDECRRLSLAYLAVVVVGQGRRFIPDFPPELDDLYSYRASYSTVRDESCRDGWRKLNEWERRSPGILNRLRTVLRSSKKYRYTERMAAQRPEGLKLETGLTKGRDSSQYKTGLPWGMVQP